MVANATPPTQSSYLRLVAEDKKGILYRPNFAKITGSATAALLLQQIVFLWDSNHGRPFYKFKEPCKHSKYKYGDSWCEELAFSRTEFDGALAKIGTKVTEGKSKGAERMLAMPQAEDFAGDTKAFGEALKIAVQHLVIYWTDGNRVTWYDLNQELFNKLIEVAYGPKVEILLYLDKARNLLYLGKEENPLYLSSETTRDYQRINTFADSDKSHPQASDSTSTPKPASQEINQEPTKALDAVPASKKDPKPTKPAEKELPKENGDKERVSPVLAQVIGATDPVIKESPYGHNDLFVTALTLYDCELAGELRFKAKADVWVEWGNWCDEVHINDQQPARLAFFKGWDKSREDWNKARFEEIGKASTQPDMPQPIPFLAIPPIAPELPVEATRPVGADKYNELRATSYYAVNHALKQVALSPAEQYEKNLSTPGWVHEMGIVIKTSEAYLEYTVIPEYPSGENAPSLNGQGARTDDLPLPRPTTPETKQEPLGGVFPLPPFANLAWYTCAGENTLVHLAKPTPSGQRLKPICGVKGHFAAPVETASRGNRQPCPDCQRIAVERAAKAEKVKFRKPQRWDTLFDSACAGLAGHKECTAADRVAFGWRAGKIIHGDDDRGCDGLIVYECARQGKVAENLDYKDLATTMDLFWPNFHRYHPDLDLKDCVKFIEYWGQFRVAQDKKQKPTGQDALCPVCGGQRVTFIDDPAEPGQKLAIPCECQKVKVS